MLRKIYESDIEDQGGGCKADNGNNDEEETDLISPWNDVPATDTLSPNDATLQKSRTGWTVSRRQALRTYYEASCP